MLKIVFKCLSILKGWSKENVVLLETDSDFSFLLVPFVWVLCCFLSCSQRNVNHV